MSENRKIILFISRESAVYSYVRRQVELACERAGGAVLEVVDIAERPEMAEQYNIEALPTLIIDDKRFVGSPTQEILEAGLKNSSGGAAPSGRS